MIGNNNNNQVTELEKVNLEKNLINSVLEILERSSKHSEQNLEWIKNKKSIQDNSMYIYGEKIAIATISDLTKAIKTLSNRVQEVNQ